MDWQRTDKLVTTHLGSILVIALVGITAFILGSQFRTNLPPDEEVATTTEEVTNTSPVITQLQQLISNPQSPAPAPTTTTAIQPTGLVNINFATLTELDSLPGIGPVKAQAIIDHRQANGPFIRAEDLMNVKGIGPKTLENLRALITL